MMSLTLLLLSLTTLARAEQSSFVFDPGTGRYAVTWRDETRASFQLEVNLPTSAFQNPELLERRVRMVDLYTQIGQRLESWASKEGIELHATPSAAGVSCSFRVPAGQEARVERRVGVEQGRVTTQVLQENGLAEMGERHVTLDHALFAVEHAPDVAALAARIDASAADLSQRARVGRALSFVQGIPYLKGGRRSLSLPLGVVVANEGDCDSKSLLLLSLLRTSLPDVRSVIVYVPGHAFVGLGIPPQKGDSTLDWEGMTWVLAEPAGPGLLTLGKLSKMSRKKLKGKNVHVREVGTAAALPAR